MSSSQSNNKTTNTQSSTNGSVVCNPYTPNKKRKGDDNVADTSPVSTGTANTTLVSVSSVGSNTTGPPTGDQAIKSIKWGKRGQTQPKITDMDGFVKLSKKENHIIILFYM
jgi:hypothetical protein